LTHSLKVAQVGRSIAEQLLYRYRETGISNHLDPDVVDAACLAHDLGHPPFGHNTERELDLLLRVPNAPETAVDDGFEGNAQTFRVVTTNAIRYQEIEQKPGLNLTAATLNAILKYPWGQRANAVRHRKWGYYRFMLPDVDFSYAVHDVEDFVRAGLIPAGVFTLESNEQAWFLNQCEAMEPRLPQSDVQQVLAFVNLYRYKGTHRDHATLSEFRSETVNHFDSSLRISLTGHGPVLQIPPDVRTEIDVLQRLTRVYVIDSPAVQSQRYGQRRMIREIFTILLEEATRPDSKVTPRSQSLRIFPPLWQERVVSIPPDDLPGIQRILADHIASMTEQQVCDTFEKLTGCSQASAVEPIA
jgi:dGTPase